MIWRLMHRSRGPRPRMGRAPDVDWSSYAEVYDLMAENNPAYQDLIGEFRSAISLWQLEPQSMLADLGAGTGNFSLELAKAFPACQVSHVDADAEMNRSAVRKAARQSAGNFHCVTSDVQLTSFQPGSQSAITTVHALYAFPQPRSLFTRIFEWLRPGGYLLACDPGRIVNVSDWAGFLLRASLARQGVWRTARLFYRGRAVARQNRLIAKAQKEGVYWTHSHAEFRAAIEAAGFDVQSARETYRGYSDFVVARKPQGRDNAASGPDRRDG
jgi:ubiquinone/menaquinone biosynthesis C-methylase UbiE